MKQKNKAAGAFAMLIVSALSLMVASYAWFSMAGSVTAKTPDFSASAPENLQISSDGQSWASAINVNLGNRKDLQLNPASSYAGTNDNIFYTDTINNGNSDENTKFFSVTSGTTVNNAGYYMDVPLWIRTTGSEDVDVALDVDDEATSVKDIDSDGKISSEKTISNSVRIAFINPGMNKNSLGEAIVEGNPEQNGQPFVYNANKTNKINEKVIAAIDNTGKATKKNPVYLQGNTTKILAIKGSRTDNSGYQDGTKFVARIWLEGEDPNCIFANGGKSFSISLKFVAVNK